MTKKNSCTTNEPQNGVQSTFHLKNSHTDNVSVLGQEEGYTVKYIPPPEGGDVYLTVYPESSPNTDIISF